MPDKLSNQKHIIFKIIAIFIIGVFVSVIWSIMGYYDVTWHFFSFMPFLLLIILGLCVSLPNKILFAVIYLLEMLHCILLIVVGVKGGDFDDIAKALSSLNFLLIDLITTILFISILIQKRKHIISRKKLLLEILLLVVISFVLFMIYHAIVFSGIFPKYGSILPFLN